MYLTIVHLLVSDALLGLGDTSVKTPEALDRGTYILVGGQLIKKIKSICTFRKRQMLWRGARWVG